MERYEALTERELDGLRAAVSLTNAGVENVQHAWAAIEKVERIASANYPARAELLAQITRALRLEGFTYMNYGPRAADFIDAHFGGQ